MKTYKHYLIFILMVWLVSLGNTLAQQPLSRKDFKKPSAANLLFTRQVAGVGFYPSSFRQKPLSEAQSTSTSEAKKNGPSVTAASQVPVTGGGTLGQLSKWVGTNANGGFILGDTGITETKDGRIGIGTTTPTSKLTVQGMIETTLGGYRFPDGTVQTTAAVSGLQAIFHDATLAGDGSSAAPLKLVVPLNLSGAIEDDGAVLSVTNTTANNLEGGDGLHATGGTGSAFGGTGIIATGGQGNNTGGTGIRAIGNSGTFGGDGIFAEAGDTRDGGVAGVGVVAVGGKNTTTAGGSGVHAIGAGSVSGPGGEGIFAFGGDSVGGSGGDAVVAIAGAGPEANGLAGDFFGNVSIAGDLNVTGTKNFKIDHPLDPANKYLIHAAIESSEVLNVYSGNAKLDSSGAAIITLPKWFEAINRDYRYTLTAIGAPAPGLYIAEKISGNRFKIAGGMPDMEVSWQVTGVRADAALLKHPFKIEEEKTERERGLYLTPEAYGQPEEKSLGWAHRSTLMKRAKEIREQQPRKLEK